MSGGKKFDNGKPPMDLIPYDAEIEIAKVLQFGLEKYGPERANWAKGIQYSRLIAASLRHIKEFNTGVDLADDSNLNHIAHAATNLIFLLWMQKHRPDLDDRWEKVLQDYNKVSKNNAVLESVGPSVLDFKKKVED
jgi:hypothetical protein